MKGKEIVAILLLVYILGFVSALLYVDKSRQKHKDVQIQIVEDVIFNIHSIGPIIKPDLTVQQFVSSYEHYGFLSTMWVDHYLDQVCGYPPTEIQYVNLTEDFYSMATEFCEEFHYGNKNTT